MSIAIRPECDADRAAIDEVHRLAFGRSDEARRVERLRDEGYARLSLVAQIDGRIVGHILFSELQIQDSGTSTLALALAPLAVLPQQQGQGIGAQLVQCGLAAARQARHRIVVVLGEPTYYRRFGFASELARSFDSPYAAEALMALELVAGAVDGVSGKLEYPPPFAAV